MLRDSYACGVKYGVYDIDRLMCSFTHVKDTISNEKVIGIKKSGIHSLEQFVLAKYYMTTQVYRHRVRLITDNMIQKGLTLGIEEDNHKFLHKLYNYDGSPKHLGEWVTWDDKKIINTICETRTGYAREYFLMLQSRDLLKCIVHLKIHVSNFLDHEKIIPKILEKNYDPVELENCITSEFGIAKNYVIAYQYTIKSVREQSRDTEGKILVQISDSKIALFEDESLLFNSINVVQMESYLDIYAKIRYRDAKHKEDIQNKATRLVQNYFINLYKEEDN